jgi:hypothetical protein
MKKIFAFIVLFSLLFVCFLPLSFSKPNVIADVMQIDTQVNPDYIGTSPQMQITFSSPYDFAKGDEIGIEIDQIQVYKKDSLINYISINGEPPLAASLSGSDMIEMTIPSDLSKGQSVKISINSGALINPNTAGYYKLTIYLKGEEYSYTYYHVVDTTIVQDVSLKILNNGFEIQFKTGINGDLQGSTSQSISFGRFAMSRPVPKDYIYINFSPILSTTFSRISSHEVTINGSYSLLNPGIITRFEGTSQAQNFMSIAVPKNISGSVDIIIKGINNPLVVASSLSGDAYVDVSTSKETTGVKSNVITFMSAYYIGTTMSIDPAAPDGEKGYYITKPTVSLVAESGSSITKTETYVSIDGNDYQLYTDPIVFSDGTHSLNYYSIGHIGNIVYKEDVKNVVVKVDTTSPVINVISPFVTDSRLYTLKIDVTDDNIQEVSVTLGSITFYPYESQIEIPTVLFNNDTTLYIKAVDIAGNITEYSNVIKLSLSL